jgi:predicted dehydrogenase
MPETQKIRVGLIGLGYWGPNLARNVDCHPQAKLVAVCDADAGNRERAMKSFPGVSVMDNSYALLNSMDIDAVVIATPASTHFSLVEAAFAARKHVLVTKPLSTSSASALSLAELAEATGKVLLVDHTFLYTHAVTALKNFIKIGTLGKPLYYDSMRTGLGIFKTDANVIDDLAVHDIAIVDHIFDERPFAVSATSAVSIPGQLPSLAYINFYYSSGLHVHIAAHWLSPIKQRNVVIAGDLMMACWDETSTESPLQIYDSGVSVSREPVLPGRAPLEYRHGPPKKVEIGRSEALADEIDDFVHSILNSTQPRSGGRAAARVMRLAEAADQSARQYGVRINIDW